LPNDVFSILAATNDRKGEDIMMQSSNALGIWLFAGAGRVPRQVMAKYNTDFKDRK